MFTLTKLFDKTVLAQGETIQRFFYDASGKIAQIETNLSVYQLIPKV